MARGDQVASGNFTVAAISSGLLHRVRGCEYGLDARMLEFLQTPESDEVFERRVLEVLGLDAR